MFNFSSSLKTRSCLCLWPFKRRRRTSLGWYMPSSGLVFDKICWHLKQFWFCHNIWSLKCYQTLLKCCRPDITSVGRSRNWFCFPLSQWQLSSICLKNGKCLEGVWRASWGCLNPFRYGGGLLGPPCQKIAISREPNLHWTSHQSVNSSLSIVVL